MFDLRKILRVTTAVISLGAVITAFACVNPRMDLQFTELRGLLTDITTTSIYIHNDDLDEVNGNPSQDLNLTVEQAKAIVQNRRGVLEVFEMKIGNVDMYRGGIRTPFTVVLPKDNTSLYGPCYMFLHLKDTVELEVQYYAVGKNSGILFEQSNVDDGKTWKIVREPNDTQID